MVANQDVKLSPLLPINCVQFDLLFPEVYEMRH